MDNCVKGMDGQLFKEGTEEHIGVHGHFSIADIVDLLALDARGIYFVHLAATF